MKVDLPILLAAAEATQDLGNGESQIVQLSNGEARIDVQVTVSADGQSRDVAIVAAILISPMAAQAATFSSLAGQGAPQQASGAASR